MANAIKTTGAHSRSHSRHLLARLPCLGSAPNIQSTLQESMAQLVSPRLERWWASRSRCLACLHPSSDGASHHACLPVPVLQGRNVVTAACRLLSPAQQCLLCCWLAKLECQAHVAWHHPMCCPGPCDGGQGWHQGHHLLSQGLPHRLQRHLLRHPAGQGAWFRTASLHQNAA